MQVESLTIPEVECLTPEVFRDHREFCTESWSHRTREAAGTSAAFVQDNYAHSRAKGTGFAVRFSMWLSMCRSSPTYGKHVNMVLSAENSAQLWILGDYAHGYSTLEPDRENSTG
jgi:dTDP-4-dehydrorhamnose 3,5-epimerase